MLDIYCLSTDQFELGHLVAREAFNSGDETKDELGPKVSYFCILATWIMSWFCSYRLVLLSLFMVGTSPSSPKS